MLTVTAGLSGFDLFGIPAAILLPAALLLALTVWLIGRTLKSARPGGHDEIPRTAKTGDPSPRTDDEDPS